jgi:glutamyl-tRNA synthetase
MNPSTTDSSNHPVRVRLAPSPTGFVHIGNACTALINAAFAVQQGGTLAIRIEDTDQKRFVQEAEDLIYDSLRWLGLEWDEAPDRGGPYGPYRQSERLPLYREVADDLIARGRAYYCWCSPDRLDQMRREQQARKQPPKYDRLCLGKTESERKHLGGYTDRPVIRFRMPDDGQTCFVDVIRGDLTFENALLDDRVLLKSDGYPSGPFAIPVDDHQMRISHVIRGEEWLSSTPLYAQIYQALGWELPAFAHVPLLLNSDRGKISKRKHPWAYMAWFQEQGFLPETVVNYLGNLTVLVPEPDNPDPSVRRELFGFDEVAQYLDLAKIGPSGKILDLERLDWLNGQYIRRMSTGELVDKVRPFMEAAGLPVADDVRFPAALTLEHERIKRLSEVPQVLSFFFRDEPYDRALLLPRGLEQDKALDYLRAAKATVQHAAADPSRWEPAWLETQFRNLAEGFGLQTGRERGQFFMVVRVAVTGRTATPPLFDTMVVLGPDTVMRRVEVALGLLAAYEQAAAAALR